MNKGQAIINLIIGVGSGMFILIVGWNSWLTPMVIVNSNQEAVAVEQFQEINRRFDNIDNTLNLIAPRLGINPAIGRLSTSTE